MKIKWGWKKGQRGKGLLFEEEGELRLVLWQVSEEDRTPHLE